jgi:hypothetical protein
VETGVENCEMSIATANGSKNLRNLEINIGCALQSDLSVAFLSNNILATHKHSGNYLKSNSNRSDNQIPNKGL